MRGDESELKAAGKETEHQQHIGAMAERFPQRVAHGLLLSGFGAARCRRCRERERERNGEEKETGEDDERRLPALAVDQGDAERREQKLPERSGGRAEAEREAAPFRLHDFSESGEHDVERAAGKPEADQDAGGEIERDGRRRNGHQGKARRIEHDAGAEHAHGAELVGDGAGERLTDAPQQILDREGEREYIAAPAMRTRHRRQKNPKAERGPKVSMAIKQPQTRTTAGVRQLVSVFADMGGFLRRLPPGLVVRKTGAARPPHPNKRCNLSATASLP